MEIDIQAEIAKAQKELNQFQTQLLQAQQTVQTLSQQVIMRQGIIAKLRELNGENQEAAEQVLTTRGEN